jgi:hypothetical protein
VSVTESAEQAVRDTIVRVSHYLDGRRFAELRALYAAEVELDYRQLFGGEVQRVPADVLIGSWRMRLAPLEATQHLFGPIDAVVEGGKARAECHVRAQHWHAEHGEWVVSGHYRFELAFVAGAWRITHHALDVHGEAGSRAVIG